MDAALLLHPRDVLYYAGTVRPAVLLVAPRSGQSQTEPRVTLFVRRGLEYARREATVARVEPMSGFASVAEAAVELGLTGGAMGTELDVVPARVYRRLAEIFPAWELADVSPLVLAQRAVKDEEEIAAMRRAAAVADARPPRRPPGRGTRGQRTGAGGRGRGGNAAGRPRGIPAAA